MSSDAHISSDTASASVIQRMKVTSTLADSALVGLALGSSAVVHSAVIDSTLADSALVGWGSLVVRLGVDRACDVEMLQATSNAKLIVRDALSAERTGRGQRLRRRAGSLSVGPFQRAAELIEFRLKLRDPRELHFERTLHLLKLLSNTREYLAELDHERPVEP